VRDDDAQHHLAVNILQVSSAFFLVLPGCFLFYIAGSMVNAAVLLHG
jgi:hypothetical protein